MPSQPRVWRYFLAPTHRSVAEKDYDSWSVVFIDAEGFVAVISDHGSWSYCWPPQYTAQKDTRRALLDFDYDYVARKLGRQRELHEYDHDATVKHLREEIARHRRKMGDRNWWSTKSRESRYYSREEAREDWDRLGDCSYREEVNEWLNTCRLNRLLEGGLYEDGARTRRSAGLDHWSRVSFKRLQAAIREDLEREVKETEHNSQAALLSTVCNASSVENMPVGTEHTISVVPGSIPEGDHRIIYGGMTWTVSVRPGDESLALITRTA